LNLKLIPNISNIDLEFIRDFKNGHTIYSIPYLWGSSGFAYNRDVIQSIFGEITIDSWAYMFDPVNLQKLKRKGIASTASGNELFCAIGLWQGYLPHHYTEDLIHIAAQYARLARPYWRVFLSSESAIQALGSGEVALAFIWNGDAVAAQNLGNIQGQTIQYVIPKEGALKWIDSLAIPYNAPHTEAAHTFINFLLDPQNMAEVTNYVQFANTSTHSKKFIKPEIINNPVLYPAAAYMQRLILDTRTDPKLERTINRQFFKILVGY
jgi:putrescine transport system substrate-binding protein